MSADTLVPPARLGALLVERRRSLGIDLAEMASRSNGAFTPTFLENAERGRSHLDDQTVSALVALYHVEGGPVVPQRSQLVLDIDRHEILVGDQSVPFSSMVAEDVLERYVGLIYRLRNQSPGTNLTLRDEDLDVLATGLGYSPADVRHSIYEIIAAPASVQRAKQVGKGKILAAAGILVGLTTVGALVLVGGPAGTSASTPQVLGVSQTLVSTGLPAEIGAQAEATINFDFRSELPGWQFVFADASADYLGVTLSESKTVVVHVQDGATADGVAEVLMHEVGHAFDLERMTDAERAKWIELRDMPATWWPGNGLSDFAVGAGDFAEAVAAYTVDSPSNSAYGEFTAEQLAFVADILESAS